ncbi:Detected protein of confused Function [Hibiscus syriacus]|uniref:Detected protein of confused Function n=1 Tax=Hibiscus syriacus TaxID=106335 RepID=A0A6A3B1U1_HIBSY|nr:Detected protein of confused Function [Hibiscus syriacus]
MPFTPGMEAVGEVIAVGPGLTCRKVGDIVAYAGDPMDLPSDKVVLVPRSVDPIIPTSIMRKAITAQFLVRRCFKLLVGLDLYYASGRTHLVPLSSEPSQLKRRWLKQRKMDEKKYTFQGSLACLKPRGYMVSFGQSSGTPDLIQLSALAAKSLFLIRPSMMHYTSTQDELLETAGEV